MPTSDKKRKFINQYNYDNYDMLSIRIRRGSKVFLKELAKSYGVSLTTMVMRAIFQMVENDPPEKLSENIKGQLGLLKKDIMEQAERGKRMREATKLRNPDGQEEAEY